MKIKIIAILVVLTISCKYYQKDFPLFKQNSAKECGPTCLKMILAYYDKNVSIETLNKLSKVNDEKGTNLLDLSTTIERFGFRTLGVRLPYEDLKQAPLPAMLFWNKNHFVVLYEFKNDSLFIADPALGKMKYSKDIFCKHWYDGEGKDLNTGVALLIEKSKK